MKFAFSKNTPAAQTGALLASFRAAGFDGLQLKGAQYEPFLGEPRRFLELGAKPGDAAALIAGGTLDDDGRAHLRRIMAFGRAVGSEKLVFCHGVPRDGLSESDIRDFARPLGEAAREASDYGLSFSLHHHFGQPLMHRDDLWQFFDAAAREPIGLTIDTAHLVKSGITDIAGVIHEFAPRIDNFHLKDWRAGEFEVLGRGEIDFAPVFAAMRAIGYDGWVSADEESGATLDEALTQCAQVLQQFKGDS